MRVTPSAVFLLVLLLSGVDGQAACSFDGCDCSAGTSCSPIDTVTIVGHQTVTGGDFVMNIWNQIIMDIPTSKLTVRDGNFVESGSVNFTISSDPGEPYSFIEANQKKE